MRQIGRALCLSCRPALGHRCARRSMCSGGSSPAVSKLRWAQPRVGPSCILIFSSLPESLATSVEKTDAVCACPCRGHDLGSLGAIKTSPGIATEAHSGPNFCRLCERDRRWKRTLPVADFLAPPRPFATFRRGYSRSNSLSGVRSRLGGVPPSKANWPKPRRLRIQVCPEPTEKRSPGISKARSQLSATANPSEVEIGRLSLCKG